MSVNMVYYKIYGYAYERTKNNNYSEVSKNV